MDKLKKSGIDFVILWVDGSDVEWQKEKQKYDSKITDASASAARYRDWNNLKYWFRGVEKYAPWVNNIFFVTWGHLPDWLNTSHPKLKIINHRAFIPEKYLPTFNSNAIELNLHRIEELSECFVLFNDDMFLIDTVKPTDFFVNEIPCDEFIMNAITPNYNMPIIGHTMVNNVSIINKYFKKKKDIKENFSKVYSLKYGKQMFRNNMLGKWPMFTGFYNSHIPLAHLKSTFETLWEKEPEMLDETCGNKFRTYKDLNHWLMRYWNLCSGNFIPRKYGFGKMFTVNGDNQLILQYIEKQKGKMICVNDSSQSFDFERSAEQINASFNRILPQKSEFEI